MAKSHRKSSRALSVAQHTYKLLKKQAPITRAIKASLRKTPKKYRKTISKEVARNIISHMRKSRVITKSLNAVAKKYKKISHKRSHKKSHKK